MIDFPSPILSVSADVLKDLDGEDAVLGMWTLFTKCKQSLSEGRRLENISWRLWFREMASSHCSPPQSPGSVSPPLSDVRSQSPMTPVSEYGPISQNEYLSQDSLMPSKDEQTAHSWHGENLAPLPSAISSARRLSTASMPARPPSKLHAPPRAGKLILDMLPAKLDVPPHASQMRKPRSKLISGAVSHTTSQGIIAQPRPVVPLPTMQLPSTPPSVTGTPTFPRVVVVNPTPHPTPPATPHALHPVTALSANPAPTHLLPPPLGRALFTTATSHQRPVSSTEPSSPSPVAPTSSSKLISGLASAAPIVATRPSTPKPPLSSASKLSDETLKPSDRRFFLQHSDSPELNPPEAVPVAGTSKQHPDAPPEPSPSSETSSQMKSDGITVGARRALGKAHTRKSKEVIRHAPVRAMASRVQHAQRQMSAQRKVTGEPKKTFNIGSTSSNGSRATTGYKAPAVRRDTSVPRPPSPPKNAIQQKAGNLNPQVPHRGLVMSTSSEYETTDTDEDDSEWASEDNSPDEQEIARQREETRLREAVEEAQRQRDMFAKVPKRSYSNLNRTRSGLLSQLLNPDPSILPLNHPHRSSMSSQDMTQLGRQQGRAPGPALTMSKSSAAIPLAAQVTAQAPPTNGSSQHGYRPKGRPQGEEMEDDSDSDDENPENTIQLSRSLAQQKLAALADPNRRRNSDRGPSITQEPAPVRPTLTTVATAPISLAQYPYNLPAPAPPMTPRTTRRQMLSTELSESLRRNLLWERQVSKINMTGGARRGGLLSGGLRPLTTVNAQEASTSRNGDNKPDERDERKRAAMARNRSWADDYHYSGW